MVTRLATGTVILLVVVTAASMCSPVVRGRLSSYWEKYGAWNEEARRADPIGFAKYASGKLAADLEVMQHTRRELSAEIGQLSAKLRNQQAFRDQAQQLAEEFRGKYQAAVQKASFPIQVRSASYTQQQAKSQVSMILAELAGHQSATARLEKVKKQAETQLEALAMRINASESQLAALSVQQEMLRAQQLSDEGEKLLAQVDQLLDDNSRALEENPVRTVRELLGASDNATGKQANEEAVDAFLAQKVTPCPHAVVAAQPVLDAGVTVDGDCPDFCGGHHAQHGQPQKWDCPPPPHKKPAAPALATRKAARTIKVEKADSGKTAGKPQSQKTDAGQATPEITVILPSQPAEQQSIGDEPADDGAKKPIFQQF